MVELDEYEANNRLYDGLLAVHHLELKLSGFASAAAHGQGNDNQEQQA